jgi:hypothetical protein
MNNLKFKIIFISFLLNCSLQVGQCQGKKSIDFTFGINSNSVRADEIRLRSDTLFNLGFTNPAAIFIGGRFSLPLPIKKFKNLSFEGQVIYQFKRLKDGDHALKIRESDLQIHPIISWIPGSKIKFKIFGGAQLNINLKQDVIFNSGTKEETSDQWTGVNNKIAGKLVGGTAINLYKGIFIEMRGLWRFTEYDEFGEKNSISLNRSPWEFIVGAGYLIPIYKTKEDRK